MIPVNQDQGPIAFVRLNEEAEVTCRVHGFI